MKRIIHHIRKQPEDVRIHILNLSLVVSAIILFFLWIYSLGSSFSKNTQEETTPKNTSNSLYVGGASSVFEYDNSSLDLENN